MRLPSWPEHLVGNVERVLGDEVDADALGADQADHLLDLVEQRARRLVEQKMRLVEEEHELGLVRIADLGQLLEQLGQQPEQEGGVQLGRHHQPVGGEQVDHAPAVAVRAHQVLDVERRLAEEVVAALLLEGQQAALDRADRGGADPAVLQGQIGRVLADEVQQRAQILQIEQQQALLVGDPKADVEDALLGLVQAQQPRQQQRPHLGYRGPDRMALLAEQIPEHGRKAAQRVVGEADRRRRARRASDLAAPAWLMPARSPLTSAMNTGTPRSLKPSARICRDTVLPVPVAPAIRP